MFMFTKVHSRSVGPQKSHYLLVQIQHIQHHVAPHYLQLRSFNMHISTVGPKDKS